MGTKFGHAHVCSCSTWREWMRKLLLWLFSVVVVGLVLTPPVSAGKTTVVTVPDKTGDLGKYNVFVTVGNSNGAAIVNNTWGDNAPVLQAGYVDMVSVSFGFVKDHYVFRMKVAGDLPQIGTKLPPGVVYLVWNLWMEDSAWTYSNAARTLYQAWLQFDGSSYSAILMDATQGWNLITLTPLPFTLVDERTFEIRIFPDQIGNLGSFWWSAGTFTGFKSFTAPPWLIDILDMGLAPDQVWSDFPWPLP